ncbi:hypothetical protein KXS12_16290 [Priestia filamentosa]|uniref:hypothetical protein n=1 Tax=Priestia filamentosa TaxID=1402861 RepID=UPI003F1770CD
MGRSSDSMTRAIFVYKGKVRPIEPKEALLYREKGMYEGHTLYCENHIKCGCLAKLTPTNYIKKKGFRLKNTRQNHVPNCRYFVHEESLIHRIKGKNQERDIVIKIKSDDVFGNSPKKKTENTLTDDGQTKRGTRSRKENHSHHMYIKTVTELIDLLHSQERDTIKYVYKQLYQNNMFYKRDKFDDLWSKRPKHTIMVEGFLAEWDIDKLNEKGFVYAYPDKGSSSVKLMLIYNGEGKERFKDTLYHLMNWIKERDGERRKLAIIKGNIQKVYPETKIIKFNVKDIDIKYRKRDF